MARGRGRRIAVLVAALGVAAMAGAGWAFRSRIAEEWGILRLPASEREDGYAIAERLCRGTPRARRAAEDWYIGHV